MMMASGRDISRDPPDIEVSECGAPALHSPQPGDVASLVSA